MASRQTTEPERSCIGCRKKSSKSSLVRIVWSEGKLRLDQLQRFPGRGAYLHSACALKMPPVGVWERMLRLNSGELLPDSIRALREELLLKFN